MIWHEAILDTRHYQALCRAFTKAANWKKRLIHHNPQGGESKDELARMERRVNAREWYRITFQTAPPSPYWDDEKDDVKAEDTIIVRTLTGKKIELKVTPQTTIAQLMLKLKDREGFPVCDQRLLFAGQQLSTSDLHSTNNAKTLQEFNIGSGSIIDLILRMSGC